MELKFCLRCRMSLAVCYCEQIRPFDAGPLLAVLVHPRENRKRIGTNRMVQLGVANSLRFQGTGEQIERNAEIDALLKDPSLHGRVLYPGKNAIDLDLAKPEELQALAPGGKRLLVFVIDGTWDQAQQMLHRSPKLRALPQVMFQPRTPSDYRIRKQPHEVCLSTVEAVHALLDRLDRVGLYRLPRNCEEDSGPHSQLLTVFRQMVDRQLQYQQNNNSAPPA
ncbi:MAG: DTW domain-containing protein [Oligoflexia bacterium]|nr:DTW domain-containing protein [Oligoflexia bacterium]